MIERVTRYIADPASGSFEELALEAFAFQYERIEPYRRLCERRGISPATVASWREVPLVPAAAFKTLCLAAAPARETFRSSGTSGGAAARAVHHHAYPELYRQAIDASFPRFCLTAGARPANQAMPPILALVPSRDQAPDSSLSFMVDHILTRYGGPGSSVAFGRRGVEVAAARSWAGARQREGRPVLILATSLALAQWLEALGRQDLRFRMAAGSVVFDTGGFKGHDSEVSRTDLLTRLAERLAVPPAAVVREYGMAELTSQCYTRSLAGGDGETFVAPHWVRVRVLDPATLAEAPPGAPGLVAVFVEAQAVAGVLTQGVKVSVRRVRPDGSNRSSFPSGHSSASFATADVLERHFGWKAGVPAYIAAAYVGASRLSERQHYLSDVIFGAAIGIAASRSLSVAGGRAAVRISPMPLRKGAAIMITAGPIR